MKKAFLACRGALAAAALLLLAPPSMAASSVRVVTDVWGGSGNGNIGQGCTTFAPIPDLNAFFGNGGFRAVGGNTACGYAGVTADVSSATGPVVSHQVLPPVALDAIGGSYGGSADARASYGSIGVATQGVLVGTTSGGTAATTSAAAAFFHDTLTASSPFIAAAAPGFVRYVFSLDGALSTSAQAGGASIQLNLQQAGSPVLGLARLASQGNAQGTFSAVDSDPSTWLLGPGSVSGSGLFGSTIHVNFFGDVDLPMNWSTPWDVTVGLLALGGRSADIDFFSTARLVDVQLFDALHQRVTDVVLTSASGTNYIGPSIAPVPEPETWAMLAAGLLVMGRLLARRRAAAR